MKNKKRVAALLAGFLFAGALTGCGSNGADGSNGSSDGTSGGGSGSKGEIALLPMTLDNEF